MVFHAGEECIDAQKERQLRLMIEVVLQGNPLRGGSDWPQNNGPNVTCDLWNKSCRVYTRRYVPIVMKGLKPSRFKPELVRRIFRVEAEYREDPLTNRCLLVPCMLSGDKTAHSTNGSTPAGAEAHLSKVVDEKSPH